jgi:hypothetical protein
VTITGLGQAFDNVSGDKTATATPAAGDLIVVVEATTGIGTTPATTSVSDNNPDGHGTYTQAVGPGVGFSTAGQINIWIRNALVNTSASTDFLLSVGSSSGGGLFLFSVTGMSRTGGTAIYSSGISNNGAPHGTPSVAMSVTPAYEFPVIAVAANVNVPCDLDPRTSPVAYTLWVNDGYYDINTNAALLGVEVMFADAGETTTPIAWESVSVSGWGAVAVQLDASPGGDGTVQLPLVGHARRTPGG